MKQPSFVYLLFILGLLPFTSFGQIVFSEVSTSNEIELTNNGATSVNVASYWICDFPAYAMIDNLSIVCGDDLILDPGESITVLAVSPNIMGADGELGLYTSTAFADPNSIIDYVEWGSTGHTRSAVAVSAGIWTTGDFVPAFAANNAIIYDGSGDASTDWSENSPTGCNQSCTAEGGTLTGGPFEFCAGDSVADNIPAGSISLSGNSGSNSQWVITDDQGNILGLPPMPSMVDFDGAGNGTCLVWHLSFEDGLQGAEVGMNANNLTGCFSLSNPISVFRTQPEGGTLTGGPFEFCVGDGVADNLAAGSITLNGNNGSNSQWVITDDQGNILGLPPMPSVVDFEGAGTGVCLVWHLSFEDGIQGAEVGMNANNLQGCYSLSNPISVARNDSGAICNNICPAQGGTLTGGPFAFCVDDGEADNIAPGSINLSGNSGSNSAWVVTDDLGNILGLPPMPSVVDFDGAGEGTCLVWHLSFEDGLQGAEVGLNANNLVGCFSLSNPISVERTICCTVDLCSTPDFEDLEWTYNAENDINNSNITIGNAQLTLSRAFNGTAVADENQINDSQTDGGFGIRLGVDNAVGSANNMVATYSVSEAVCNLNFDLWDVDQTDEIIVEAFYNGIAVPYTASLGSCVQQASNSFTPNGSSCEIQVNGSSSHKANISIQGCINELRITSFDQGAGTGGSYTIVFVEGCTTSDVSGGSLSGGPFEFCVDDGEADNILNGAITLTGNNGSNSQWVVTDDQGNILGLPPSPSAVNFDGAGVGTCLVWHLSFEDGLQGATIGQNANDFDGCYSLSNPISVIRAVCCENCSVPDIAWLDGSDNAEYDINTGNVTVGSAVLTLDREFNGTASADENKINSSQTTGDIGVRLGVRNAVGAANNMVATYSFSEPVCNFAFDIWDIDQTDEIIVEAFNNGTPVPYTAVGSGFCILQNGISFTPNGAACEIQVNGSVSHKTTIDLNSCVTELRITSFDQGSGNGGSYTVVFDEGCTGGVSGGILTGGPFEFCVGDGVTDNIPAGSITLSGNTGPNNAWVVTDDQGNILGLPPMPSVVDFDGAGFGTCLVWHLSYEDGLQGAEVGMNANDLIGCYSLSNPISVNRNDCDPNCMVEGGTLAGGPFEFCVGDGVTDNIPAGSITLSGNSGSNSQWVVTDDQGNILGLPPMPSVVDFDGAGNGTCLVWHLSFEDGLQGAEVGMNANDLVGCYSLSNPISVFRTQPEGGIIAGISNNMINRTVIANRGSGTVSVIKDDNFEFTFEMPDNGEPMYVVHNTYNNSVLIGDYNGQVAAFDGETFQLLGTVPAGLGVFHMWLSPDKQQLWVNNELDKTISIVNPNTLQSIATIQLPSDLLAAGFKPHDVIVMPDNSAAFVTVLGPLGEDYVIKYSASTFQEIGRAAVGKDPHVVLTPNNDKLYVASQMTSELAILNRSDLSEVTVLNIPNAHGLGINNAGTYLYVGNIANGGTAATFTVDLLTNTIVGAPVDAPVSVPHNYAVSDDDQFLYVTHSGGMNFKVSVYSLDPTPTLINVIDVESNPFGLDSYSFLESFTEINICAGDGLSDAFDVSLSNQSGSNSAWVITDDNGTILGLPPGPPFDLEGAGFGTCLIWHLSYEDGLQGAEVGMNANDLIGCYSLSNPISVNRNDCDPNCMVEGGTLAGGPFEFCVGDGVADNIPAGSITLSGNSGSNSQWVVTDDQGNILGLPPMPSVVDFDGAGNGTCLVWHLSFEDGLQGAELGMNANDLVGCYSLSNPISVFRTQPEGGTLTGGPFEFCAGDGVADNIPAGSIVLSGNSGVNSQWVVTDDQGNILGLPSMPSVVDFDGAGFGTCLIWHLSFEDGLQGAEVGMNANDLIGCFSLSNPISVVREDCDAACMVDGGDLSGGPFQFCVGDGVSDNIPAGSITLSGNTGANSAWVVTDDQGNILGLPLMPSVVDFDGAGNGTCLVWHLSFEDGLQGAEVGMNANDLQGCFELSNPVYVFRDDSGAACNVSCGVIGGLLQGGPFEFCVGDGIADNIPAGSISLNGNFGPNSQWIVTDDQGNILGLPPTPSAVDFDGAGTGVCLIWNITFVSGLQGLQVGMNASNLAGCYSLSNPISVIRSQPEGGTLTGGPFQFCVGDNIADNIPVGSISVSGNSGTNSAWVVTDDQGNILGLPPMPSVVDFDGAGVGVCLVWYLSFEDGLQGAAVGMNANDLVGCFSLSNPIEVLRETCGNVDCENQRQLDANPLATGLYEAFSIINSAGTVSAGAVEFTAGDCIEMQANFEVVSGNEFQAYIEGCINPDLEALIQSEEK